MSRNDERIPSRTRTLILREAHHRCPFCNEADEDALDIHHIEPRESGGTNDPSNLIAICASCHRKAKSGAISLSEILRVKSSVSTAAAAGTKPRKSAPGEALPSNVVVFRGSNTGVLAAQIVADQVRISSSSRGVKLEAPRGTIAADADRLTYVKHLIDRYLDFKRAEMGASMKFQIVYAAIKREFGCTWKLVPLHRFDDLISFLQKRIDRTILGKVQKSRGTPNYSSFEAFVATRR
jgi:hypothetical protein